MASIVIIGRFLSGLASQRILEDIVAAYDRFANQRDGELKIAIKPH
ncbi:hypothetical protein [Cupriavidus taiwanensis]|uniref:Uncharacterized protein n=1 Tax=Cupriavidus taiwanensis TaxID=164546 RepID=A0A7Z7J6A7_9BURK|nr:hypothetical protein [Cupriavidus taiwanensis]SOY86264.1 hypothetical protein CBM2598_A20727 [Cupriavidus taiwanensis]SOZ01707.1 hypothetical protein CBM2595_A30547 [Cupriavidus taiwanensis]SOZ04736.1 hypothetical protein CBM2597_A50688 [Cupriavidus taiwanensis]SPC09218.1 hypothetical protein CBM2594_A40541 [Cupriavidus taiwanensis]SPD39012.1 conserved protein of unknown function [Cupriavidus taiwanensis]